MISILTGFMLLPLLNLAWTCTLDAYIQCEMWKHREKLHRVHNYIEPIQKYRDRLFSKIPFAEWSRTTVDVLEYLKSIWKIQNREEIAPRDITDNFRWIIEVRNAERDSTTIRHGNSDINHAVCVIWEEEDKRIILNSRGTWRWYDGYWYVKKWEWLVYLKY